MASKEELLAKLSECVVEMEDEEVVEVAKEYIEAGYPAFDGIMEGLVDGMNKASELYDAEEYFVTDWMYFVRIWKIQMIRRRKKQLLVLWKEILMTSVKTW
mgnify:CR=1 FL=1